MASSRDDRWETGEAYESYIGRWSRLVAVEFIDWLRPARGLRWADIGCGTGALAAAIWDRTAPREITAVEPSEGFRHAAAAMLGDRAKVVAGDAAAIPLEDASVDAVVSGLVLNFVPDPAAAIEEMKRVVVPGGTIACYLWDYAGRMEFLRRFWDAAVALDPSAAALDEGVRFPLCNPGQLRAVFERASLSAVEVVPLDVRTRFESFDDLWDPFLGGQGPAPSYVASLPRERREPLRAELRRRVDVGSEGAIDLVARAWAVRGLAPSRPRP